jgi:hypothetical protein
MRGKYRPFAEDSKGILKNLGGRGGIVVVLNII